MGDRFRQNYGYSQYGQGTYGQDPGAGTGYEPAGQYATSGYLQDAPGTSYPAGYSQAAGYHQTAYNHHNYPPDYQGQFQPQQGQFPRAGLQNIGNGAGVLPDSLVSGLAAGMLQQQGENYFQRGQAFVQSKMGFLSSSNLQYHFNIDKTYVRDKLVLLLLPFLRQWSFSRKPEQISGGHRYQPPRQDVYAPDLYIPFMAVCTYVVLFSVLQTAAGKFTHDNVYVTVSGAFTGWLVHWVVIKATLYLLGIPSSVPFLEILAYAGYPFMYACLGMLVGFLGLWTHRVMWLYGGLAMSVFMVRTMRHVIFRDAPHFRGGSMQTYLLVGLAIFQFPFLAYFFGRP